MVKLTDIAAQKVQEFMAGQAAEGDVGLRVGVKGGGCSGFQYALALDEKRDDDHVFEASGIRVLVDPASIQYVDGSTVDFTESLHGLRVRGVEPERRGLVRLRLLLPRCGGRAELRRVRLTADRDLDWDGCVNARDLGGLPTLDGGVTRRGVLVRSETVDRLSPEGLASAPRPRRTDDHRPARGGRALGAG